MPKWEVIVSDKVTGQYMVDGERFRSGRYVTGSAVAARYLSSMDPRFVRVRELEEGEKDGETGQLPEPERPQAPLRAETLKAGGRLATRPCHECGVEFVNLEQHAAQSGHTVEKPVEAKADDGPAKRPKAEAKLKVERKQPRRKKGD